MMGHLSSSTTSTACTTMSRIQAGADEARTHASRLPPSLQKTRSSGATMTTLHYPLGSRGPGSRDDAQRVVWHIVLVRTIHATRTRRGSCQE